MGIALGMGIWLTTKLIQFLMKLVDNINGFCFMIDVSWELIAVVILLAAVLFALSLNGLADYF
jgi:hypothetical protein